MKRTMILAAMLLLAGCAPPMAWVGVKPGPVRVCGHLTVQGDPDWSRMQRRAPEPGHDAWTMDGLPLDQLQFFVGIASGDPLQVMAGHAGKQIPKFQKDMQAQEIIELYETLATLDGSTFTRGRMAPANFAGAPGFRFEFQRVRKGDELMMKGVGYGSVQKDRLYLLVYEAPRIHYFAHNLPQVEAIASSAKVLE